MWVYIWKAYEKNVSIGIGSASTQLKPKHLACMLPESESEVAQSCPNSLGPHGLYPIRLLHPWDFPGKNAGVDCHFLLQGIFLTQESNPGLPHCRQMLYRLSHQGSQVKWVSQSCPTLCDPMDSPWNSPIQNTGVGNCSILQGIFPTQGSNPGLPHLRLILFFFFSLFLNFT